MKHCFKNSGLQTAVKETDCSLVKVGFIRKKFTLLFFSWEKYTHSRAAKSNNTLKNRRIVTLECTTRNVTDYSCPDPMS